MNTSGFLVDDIPGSIKVSYATASSLGAGKNEFAGEHTNSIDCFMTDVVTSITLTVPDAGWCYIADRSDIRGYNVPSLDKRGSNSPIISFECESTLDRVNFYFNDFENVKKIDNRTIGGVDMKGRTYKYVGMDWAEYYGELPSGVYLCVKSSKIDLSAGSEGDAVLGSVTIK